MIRILIVIIAVVLFGIYSIFDAIVCFFISLCTKLDLSMHNYNVVRFALKLGIFISGIDLVVYGKENLELLKGEKAYFVISNHRGIFDIVTGYTVFDIPLGIVAKEEMRRVPVIQYWMKKINCIFLNRKNLRDGMMMVMTCIENIKNDKNI